jgi:hypothetical protein
MGSRELEQGVDVVLDAADLDDMRALTLKNSSHVGPKVSLPTFLDEGTPILRAKGEMNIDFSERLGHDQRERPVGASECSECRLGNRRRKYTNAESATQQRYRAGCVALSALLSGAFPPQGRVR